MLMDGKPYDPHRYDWDKRFNQYIENKYIGKPFIGLYQDIESQYQQETMLSMLIRYLAEKGYFRVGLSRDMVVNVNDWIDYYFRNSQFNYYVASEVCSSLTILDSQKKKVVKRPLPVWSHSQIRLVCNDQPVFYRLFEESPQYGPSERDKVDDDSKFSCKSLYKKDLFTRSEFYEEYFHHMDMVLYVSICKPLFDVLSMDTWYGLPDPDRKKRRNRFL